jgi:hypothetical protein
MEPLLITSLLPNKIPRKKRKNRRIFPTRAELQRRFARARGYSLPLFFDFPSQGSSIACVAVSFFILLAFHGVALPEKQHMHWKLIYKFILTNHPYFTNSMGELRRRAGMNTVGVAPVFATSVQNKGLVMLWSIPNLSLLEVLASQHAPYIWSYVNHAHVVVGHKHDRALTATHTPTNFITRNAGLADYDIKRILKSAAVTWIASLEQIASYDMDAVHVVPLVSVDDVTDWP